MKSIIESENGIIADSDMWNSSFWKDKLIKINMKKDISVSGEYWERAMNIYKVANLTYNVKLIRK